MPQRLLIVDDDQSLLELYRLILEREGYDVHLSKIVFEEITDVERLHPDLIILDMKIGRSNDGILLLQKLKLYPPTKDIPVIVCTAALAEIREQEETLRHKGIPVLYKPFDLDELLHLVRHTLSASSES